MDQPSAPDAAPLGPEKHVVATPEAELWLWGEPDARTNDKPVVLFIDGAFAIERPATFRLQRRIPEAAVLNAHLPGNHGPPPRTHSVAAYAAAFANALDQIGRPAIACGASVGGLVALAMRSPWIRGVVALDPPLRTGDLWPLHNDFQNRLRRAPDDAALHAFLDNVFGVSADRIEDRSYLGLLDTLETPTTVAFAEAPLLPRRQLNGIPSLVGEEERQVLRRNPRIKTYQVNGTGHNIAGRDLTPVVICVRERLRGAGLPVLDEDPAARA